MPKWIKTGELPSFMDFSFMIFWFAAAVLFWLANQTAHWQADLLAICIICQQVKRIYHHLLYWRYRTARRWRPFWLVLRHYGAWGPQWADNPT